MPFFGTTSTENRRCVTPNEVLADELDHAAMMTDFGQATAEARRLLRRAAAALRAKR